MDLQVLGTISRSHGLNGAFKLNNTVGAGPQLEKDEPVFIQLQGGPVPFFVEEYSNSGPSNVIVKLSDINSIEQIKKFVGKELLLPIERFDVDELKEDPDSLIGFEVHDIDHGYLGEISAIMYLPQQSVMVVLSEGKEILIPLVDEIIVKTDFEAKKVTVETPDGLIDIYVNG